VRVATHLDDAEGNRVAKGTISNWAYGCDTTQNGFMPTSSYVLGPSNEQLTETDGNGNWKHSNVYAAGMLIATYDIAPTGSPALHFQLSDWLGTRRVQTDISGNPEEAFTSLPFGDGPPSIATPISGAPATADDATENHFTGKERDTESGSDYFGARYYGSNMGRLLSPDPEEPTPLHLLNPQRWNMYAYGLNNPLSFTDSGGRDAAAVNFSKEIAIVGHEGIMSVHSDGTVEYARFGPAGGSRPTGPGQVQSFTLKAKIQFDSNGRPTGDSLNAVKKELGTTGPEKGQDPSSIRLNYFKTTPQETANLDQWIKQQQDASNQGKAPGYNVVTSNCTMFCGRGLVAAGVLDQNQANHASPAPNGFWLQLSDLQSREPCARTEASDDKGNSTGWSGCQ
jgi:RHS repeat-associated protein